jgi:hypothetical protein
MNRFFLIGVETPGCPGSALESSRAASRPRAPLFFEPLPDCSARVSADRFSPRNAQARVSTDFFESAASLGEHQSRRSGRVPGRLPAGQPQGEIEPRQERAGIDPGLRRIGIAGRRLAEVEGLSHQDELPREREGLLRLGAQGPHGGDDVLEGGLDLGAVVPRIEELGAREDRADGRPQFAVGREEGVATRSTSAVGGTSATRRWQS